MTSTGISFHTETVEVLTAGTRTGRYGEEQVWDDTTPPVQVERCRVLPAQGDEVLDRKTRRFLLFAPPGTELTAANRIRWQGTDFDVLDVRGWPSPTGRLAHLEADLQRVEG